MAYKALLDGYRRGDFRAYVLQDLAQFRAALATGGAEEPPAADPPADPESGIAFVHLDGRSLSELVGEAEFEQVFFVEDIVRSFAADYRLGPALSRQAEVALDNALQSRQISWWHLLFSSPESVVEPIREAIARAYSFSRRLQAAFRLLHRFGLLSSHVVSSGLAHTSVLMVMKRALGAPSYDSVRTYLWNPPQFMTDVLTRSLALSKADRDEVEAEVNDAWGVIGGYSVMPETLNGELSCITIPAVEAERMLGWFAASRVAEDGPTGQRAASARPLPKTSRPRAWLRADAAKVATSPPPTAQSDSEMWPDAEVEEAELAILATLRRALERSANIEASLSADAVRTVSRVPAHLVTRWTEERLPELRRQLAQDAIANVGAPSASGDLLVDLLLRELTRRIRAQELLSEVDGL